MTHEKNIKLVGLYCTQQTSLNVLVPKRRGSGYCKSVFGFHSHNAASEKFVTLCDKHFNWFSNGDFCDLDGFLQITVTMNWWEPRYKDGLRLALAALKSCFPFVSEFKEVSVSEFYDNVK